MDYNSDFELLSISTKSADGYFISSSIPPSLPGVGGISPWNYSHYGENLHELNSHVWHLNSAHSLRVFETENLSERLPSPDHIDLVSLRDILSFK
jgi:hypothetical protein